MTAYDEAQVVAFQADVRAAYAEAAESYLIADDAHVVWVGRMQYDALDMGYEMSRRKHIGELRRQLHLGLAVQPGQIAPRIVGTLRRVDKLFFDDNGVWPWRMITAFDAFRLYLLTELTTLDAYASYTRSVGANGWRVFMNWNVTGLDARHVPDLAAALHGFAKYTGDQGLACELVVLCDCQRFVPSMDQRAQSALVDLAADVLSSYGHMSLEIANEPWNNGVDPLAFNTKRPGLLVARGAGVDGAVYVSSLGYTTVHTRRTPEWYRYVGKDIGIDAQHITQDAVVAGEPNKHELTGYTPSDWERAGYNAAMFCAGMTVHGDSATLQRCIAPDGEENDLVRRCFSAMARVNPNAPSWAYARYGPAAPNVPMPVERDQDDDTVIRLYAKVSTNKACALSLHHSAEDGWIPKGINGWTVTSQNGPFVTCER